MYIHIHIYVLLYIMYSVTTLLVQWLNYDTYQNKIQYLNTLHVK